MEDSGECHCCGDKTDWVCETCEQWVCEDCTMPFTQMNQIDYTLCWNCNDSYQEERADELYEEHLMDTLTKEQYQRHLDTEERKKTLIKDIKNYIKDPF